MSQSRTRASWAGEGEDGTKCESVVRMDALRYGFLWRDDVDEAEGSDESSVVECERKDGRRAEQSLLVGEDKWTRATGQV